MKRFLTISLMLLLCVCFLEGCVTATVKPEPEEIIQEPINPVINSELIKTQQEIVELRQKIYNDTQIKIENAQATLQDLIDARAKLAEAKIKLAKFQDRNDILVQELQALVQFYISARGMYLDQLESGQGKGKELYEIEIALKETNIRLTQTITNLYPTGIESEEE